MIFKLSYLNSNLSLTVRSALNNSALRENVFLLILSSKSSWKCMKISLENLYVDTGTYRVNE